MAKTAVVPPALGTQGTVRKKSKKMRLLRNPFSDTESLGASSSSPSSFRNPFCDSFAFIHTFGDARSSEAEGDEDGEEDEARIMHARRQALVALDPTNRDSWKAEFKSLKEYSIKKMSLEQRRRQELELQQQQQQSRKIIASSHEPLEVLDEPLEILDEPPPDEGHEEDQVVPHATPPVSLKHPQDNGDPYDPHNRHSRNSLFSTPKSSSKRQEADVPEISISLATPPPSTQNHPHEPSCSTVADPSLLSTAYTPSPLSSSSLDPLDESWQQKLSPEKAKAKERRTTVVYKSLLQRVSPSTPAIVRPIVLSAGTVDGSNVDPVEAQIEGGGTVAPRPSASSSWSLNRNTFGAFSKLDQRHDQREEQDPLQPTKQKLKRGSRLFRKQRSSRHALDPWDSSDDMLIQVTDDDDGNESETPFSRGRDSFLKGRMGVRRASSGVRTETDQGGLVSRSMEKGSVGAEEWIVHPRTAAIKGTFHRVHEAVPVPSRDSRPSSLGPEFLTISLSSPPRHAPKHQTFGEGGASFTRAQSTDSPATPLRKGASAFLSGFGNASHQEQDSGNQAAMSRDMAERTQMRRMMNGQAQPFVAGPLNQPRQLNALNPRSSMMTFGSRMSTSSPPRITMSSSFASLRELISTATGLVRSSTPVSENTTATTTVLPFSPTTNLTRAQSTAYGGGSSGGRHSINGVHSSGTSAISFSPSSRRKTALVMMAPTIVVAQKLSSTEKDEEEKDRDASSMHTISGSPDTSASSSLTIISSSRDQVQQQQQEYEDRAEDEEVAGLELHSEHLESKKSESNGHAPPSTDSTPPRHTPFRQQLTATTATRPRHYSLLKVPEPAKAGSSNHHHHHRRQQSPPTSVAASAMAAAQRAWLSSLGLTRGERELIRSTSSSSATMNVSMDSLMGPLTGDDYIGQFERERAKARGTMMNMTTSAGSFATETETPSTTAASSSTMLTASNASDHEALPSSRGDWKMKSMVGGDETHSHSKTRPSRPPPIRRCNTSPDNHRHSGGGGGFRRSFLQTVRIRRESSGPLDMSDKLMHLPEPSRFEGMCSCRGVINIASMLLILLGLVLLILGYPIATSLNKDRVAAEAATGMSVTAPATAPESDVLVAAGSMSKSSPVAAVKRSIIRTGGEGVTTIMDKRTRFGRERRSMNVVFSDEFRRKGRLA